MHRPVPFGRPGSVTPAAIASMRTDAQRAEGVLLLTEMGLPPREIAHVIAIAIDEVMFLRRGGHPPYSREEELQ